MASSGKKRKVKGKTINLTSFLGDQDAPTGYAVVAPRRDWADYVEDEEKRSAFNKEEKIVLPTAPKAARGPDVDLNKIPSSPPFTAFVGNLPYDVMEEDIVRFFGNLNVISVRLPRDGGDRGRMRGFGYAEFEDKQSLIEALSLHQEHLKNRPIKVSLAGENENDKSGDRRNDGVDRTASDWRAAPRSNPRDDSFSSRDKPRNGTYGSKYDDDRAPYRGRNSYEADKDSYNGDSRQPYQGRRSYERDSRDYGFGRDRDGGRDRYSRDGGDRYPERDGASGYNRRYGDRGFDSYDRDGDRGGNRRYGDRGFGSDDRSRGYGGRGGGRRDDDFERRSDDRDTDAVKERPRLQLQPRTVPVEQTSGTAMPTSASSIFGAAKPVDTAAKEREIEKRLEKEKKLEEPEKSRSSTQSNRYGDSRSSDDRSYSRRDREQKSYSDLRDSRPIRSNENSPTRQYSPPRDRNYSREPREVDVRSDGMSSDDGHRYVSDILEHSHEIPSQGVKGHSVHGPHVEKENEPVTFLTNKFAHLSNQDEQDESD